MVDGEPARQLLKVRVLQSLLTEAAREAEESEDGDNDSEDRYEGQGR